MFKLSDTRIQHPHIENPVFPQWRDLRFAPTGIEYRLLSAFIPFILTFSSILYKYL